MTSKIKPKPIQIKLKQTQDIFDDTEKQVKTIIQSISPNSLSKYEKWCEQLLQKYPPKYNSNKFLYGGISERLLKFLLEHNNHSCQILGDDNLIDDIFIDNKIYMSIKTTKCNSDIIIMNYKSVKLSDNDCYEYIKNRIICVVNFYNNKLYFIVLNNIMKSIDDFKCFFVSKDANLSLKKCIFKYIPAELTVSLNICHKITENKHFDMYEKLAIEIIQSCD